MEGVTSMLKIQTFKIFYFIVCWFYFLQARVVLMRTCNLINISKEEDMINREKNKSLSINLSEGEKVSAANLLKQKFGSKKSKRVSEIGLRMNIQVSGKEEEIKGTVTGIFLVKISFKLVDIYWLNNGIFYYFS